MPDDASDQPLPASRDPGERHVEVGLGIVVRREGDRDAVLICQRKPDAVLANLWEFPGGKIEPEETPRDAVVRELMEELAIAVEPTEALAPITFSYDHATVRLFPMLCALRSGTPVAIGCQAFRWVNVDELSHHAFPSANGPLIQALLARFQMSRND